MTVKPVATLQLIRIPRPGPQAAILGLLIVATLVMPVSYRAGSDTAHAHTVFQGLIDLIAGHQHHHDGEDVAASQSPASMLFSPLPPSLLIAANHVDQIASTADPDVPEILGMSVPISALAAIQGLRLLVLALLASIVVGRLWGQIPVLMAIQLAIETPPPRAVA